MAYQFRWTFTTNGKNIYGGSLSNYVYGIDVYTETSDAVNNYTNVKTVAWVRCDGGTTTSSTFWFKENGVNYNNLYIKLGVTDDAGYAVPKYSIEKVTTYYHNADGTKSITLNFSVETEVTEGANANLNNYCLKSASISKTVELPKIDRISSFSIPSFTMGTNGTITISPYVSSFRHTLTYAFGSISGTIASNVATSTTWNPSRDLGHQIPNATYGTGTITCATYNGSTLIGSTSKSFTLYVNGDMYPSFSYTYTPNNTFNGLLLTTRSSVYFAISASGSYGSTIKSYSISGQGLNTTSSSGTSSIFDSSGTFSYTLKVTDSRNRTSTQTKSVNVYYYAKPSVSFTASRCMQNGAISDIGNYISVTVNYSFSNPNNANQNGKQIKVEYKEVDASSWSNFITQNANSYSGSQTFTNTGIIFASSKTYDFKVTLTDSFHSVISSTQVSTASCILDIEPGGVGAGKYWENGALDVGADLYCNATIYSKNGVIQTSDENYKYILEDINTTSCYTLINDTNLYGYSTLLKRLEDYDSATEISDELKDTSTDDSNIHMGLLAQDILGHELGKYIVTKELISHRFEGTSECIYGIDNYAYTSAIHGALKHEIELRDKQIELLEERIARLEELLLNI